MLNPLIVFDLDGTLIDSEPSYSQTLKDLIPEISESVEVLTEIYKGRRLINIIEDIEIRYEIKVANEFEENYRKHEIDLIKKSIKPTPGTIDMLSRNPFRYCIASSAPLEKIKIALKYGGLEQYFKDNIISSYEINTWKPEPGIFLFAAKYMKSNIDDCIVIEDSEVGIDAAKRANMEYLKYNPNLSIKYLKENREFRSMSDLLEIIKEMIK